jgi:hypothetical protein
VVHVEYESVMACEFDTWLKRSSAGWQMPGIVYNRSHDNKTRHGLGKTP